MQPSPPELRLNTQPVHSPATMRGPMYPIPGSDSPNSLGPRSINLRSPQRSPDRPRPPLTTRRRSEERLVAPKVTRRGSDQNTLQRLGGSVYSGREGSVYGGRKEVLGPSDDELRLFARHCKQFYFSLDPAEESSRFISATLAALPPTHRPAYTRLQSSLRSHAHLHHLRLRVSSFHALLSSLSVSGSLTPGSRLEVGSSAAGAEQRRRVEAFAQKWYSAGTEPFFRGLWAVLRIQSRGDAARGGAGAKRVVWEIDDAVFQESGGPDFMQEAVTILKGVLGFSDQALTAPPRLRRVPTMPRAYSDSRARPTPLRTSSATSDDTRRSRATSDPFEDAKRAAPPPPPSRRPSPVAPPSPRPSEAEDRPLLASPVPVQQEELDDELDDDDIAAEEIELNKPRCRLWTFPAHISDEEAEALMRVLPASISKDRKGKTKDCRVPLVRPARGLKSLESGEGPAWTSVEIGGDEVAKVPKEDTEAQEGVVRDGTGRMWVGTEPRSLNWTGGRWFRWLRWWRRLFGMG